MFCGAWRKISGTVGNEDKQAWTLLRRVRTFPRQMRYVRDGIFREEDRSQLFFAPLAEVESRAGKEQYIAR